MNREIFVKEQTEEFPLAFDKGWKKAVGHRITVGEFNFCATPVKEEIIISEVTSGVKLYSIPLTDELDEQTAEFECAITFFEEVGQNLKRFITKYGFKNFSKHVEKARKQALETCGEMPEVKEIDTSWIREEISEVKH